MRLSVIWAFYKKSILAAIALAMVVTSVLVYFVFLNGEISTTASFFDIYKLIDGKANELTISADTNVCYRITIAGNAEPYGGRFFDPKYYVGVKKYQYTSDACEGTLMDEVMLPTNNTIKMKNKDHCICGEDFKIKRTESADVATFEVVKIM